MPRESKDAVKKSVAVDARTYEWVMKYADEKGIDYTAAVNSLLADAKEEIEREARIKAAREQAYIEADRRIAGGATSGKPSSGESAM